MASAAKKVQLEMDGQHLADMAAHAGQASVLLRSLANPRRLMILCGLVGAERAVGEIQAGSNLSQSALSQHLAVLRQAGIVQARREGQQVFYRLLEGPAQAVMQALYRAYCAGK